MNEEKALIIDSDWFARCPSTPVPLGTTFDIRSQMVISYRTLAKIHSLIRTNLITYLNYLVKLLTR